MEGYCCEDGCGFLLVNSGIRIYSCSRRDRLRNSIPAPSCCSLESCPVLPKPFLRFCFNALLFEYVFKSPGIWSPELLSLDDAEDACPFEVLALGFHPAFAYVDDAALEDVALCVTAGARAHEALRNDFQYCGGEFGALEVEAEGGEALGCGVIVSRDCVGGEDMSRVRIWVAEEVGESYGGERVVVGVGLRIEFHHLGDKWWV